MASNQLSNLTNTKKKTIVKLDSFYFRYQKSSPFSLVNINLQIYEGEFILIGGCSGSGKTTLCHALSGLIPFKIPGEMAGTIFLFQKNIWDYTPEELAPYFGYIFQNAEEQLVNFTVYDEIAFAAENMCLDSKEIHKRVIDIAEKLNLTHLLRRSIYALSGGEKQKVILAANLILRPKILIFDEPLAFLDVAAECQFLEIITKLKQEDPSLTILVVEHRLDPFRKLLDRILIIDEKGSIPFFGSLPEYDEFHKQSSTIYLRDEILYSSFQAFLVNTTQDKSQNNFSPLNNQSNHLKNKNPPELLIEVKNMTFKYSERHPIFENYTLSVGTGEFIGIVGENGIGKTTLLYLLSRIINPQSGEIKFKGKLIEDYQTEELYCQIGFIFQNPENQIFESTINDEILFGPRNFNPNFNNLAIEEQNKLAYKYIPFISDTRQSVEELGNRNPFRLSWGQKRRLNLCSIFSYQPELLLIDEPFIGQDAQSVARVFELLHQFHDNGKTIILVSHDLELIQKHCTRIVYLNNESRSNPLKAHLDFDQFVSLKDKKVNTDQKFISKHHPSKKTSRTDEFIARSLKLKIKPTWLSTFHPMVKLFGLIALTIILFIQSSIIVLCSIFFGLLLLAASAKLDLVEFLRQIRWLIILTIVYVPLNVLFDATNRPGDEVLFFLFSNSFPVRRLALYYALRTGILIVILFSSATIFNNATSLKDLVYGAIEFKVPYRFAFAFMIGLRYIPLIRNEITVIEYAQQLRGFGVKKGSSIKKIYRHLVQRLTILLVAIFRKSNTTALALDIRGFGAFKTRTNLHHIGIKRKDYIAFILIIIIMVFAGLVQTNLVNIFQIPSLYSLFQLFLSL